MVLLHILNGSLAGVQWTARHLPVRVGRGSDNDLTLADPGVWDRHLTIAADAAGALGLRAEGDAWVTVNHQTVRSHELRAGDEVEIGAVRLRFWLAPPLRRPTGWREIAVWALLGAVLAAQVALVLWLAD